MTLGPSPLEYSTSSRSVLDISPTTSPIGDRSAVLTVTSSPPNLKARVTHSGV
jgi:hypothetical protein